LVCNWPHPVGQNHFIIMMLFNKDSAIQKSFQKILHGLQVRKFGSLPAVRTTCHTVRTLICQSIIRPNDVYFRPDPSLYREASVPACIRPDDSAARPDAFQYSIKLPILSKIIYRKIAVTVRTTWISVQTRSSP
jgi:hypothetical protein